MPHFEAEHEIHGLLFWRGHPTVLVFEADPTSGAVLMEACRPGVPLSTRTEEQQDEIIATLLRQAWNAPPAEPFRSLASMLAHRAEEVTREAAAWPDPAAVTRGLDIMAEMAASSRETVVLITDLHAGNVLRSVRAPWLVVDPKPFVGDRAYDATQHLLNCRHRLRSDPRGTIGRFSRLLEVDATRVQRWLYARLTADPRDTWEADAFELAARLSV